MAATFVEPEPEVAMPGPQDLLKEIHRRSLWQVLGLYAAGAWVVLQIVATFVEQLFLPSWVFQGTLLLLALGLPILLATAAVQKGLRSRPSRDDETVAGVRRLLTWRNALVGGGVAFVLLGVGTGGWIAMRTMGIGSAGTLVSRGILDEHTTIVLADFRSADSTLARAATEALRVDLLQSGVVRLPPDQSIRAALGRMRRPPGPVDVETARELAVREGWPAVVSGEINRLGDGFVLTAQIEAPETGEVLASRRETARDEGEIVEALDRLSGGLRERIGESLAGLRSDPPLEQVTTSDLAAFRKYSQARAADLEGEPGRALALLDEAVELDPEFAMAWRLSGSILVRTGSRGQAGENEALSRAFEVRDRLTERERYLVEGDYYRAVLDDPARAATAYENLLASYPDDLGGLINLSVVRDAERDWEGGIELLEQALAVDSTIFQTYGMLTTLRVNRGEFDAAWTVIERLRHHLPGHPAIVGLSTMVSWSQGDLERALALVEDTAPAYPMGPFWPMERRMQLAGATGRLDDAARHRRALEEFWLGQGGTGDALRIALGEALQEAVVRGDPERARRVIDQALLRYPIEDIAPMDRPYVTAGGPPLVLALALAGETERARARLEEYRREAPEEEFEEVDARRALAHILISEGQYEEALEELRKPSDNCVYCDLVAYARAYEGAGPADSAAVAWARLAEVPWFGKLNWDQFWLGPALERAAQIYDELGDLDNAAKYYARFVEVWAEADPDLRPRLRAAQARLEQILEERG